MNESFVGHNPHTAVAGENTNNPAVLEGSDIIEASVADMNANTTAGGEMLLVDFTVQKASDMSAFKDMKSGDANDYVLAGVVSKLKEVQGADGSTALDGMDDVMVVWSRGKNQWPVTIRVSFIGTESGKACAAWFLQQFSSAQAGHTVTVTTSKGTVDMPVKCTKHVARSETHYTFEVELKGNWIPARVVSEMTYRGVHPPMAVYNADTKLWEAAPTQRWEITVPGPKVFKLADGTQWTKSRPPRVSLTVAKADVPNVLLLIPHKVAGDGLTAFIRLQGAYCPDCRGTHDKSDPCVLRDDKVCWNPQCEVERGTTAWYRHDCEATMTGYDGGKRGTQPACVELGDLTVERLGKEASTAASSRLKWLQEGAKNGRKRAASSEVPSAPAAKK